MKAIRLHAPHDLRVDDIEPPTITAGQALITIHNGGICGSDLHYYHEGGFGSVRIKEPLILGHEIVGQISALEGSHPSLKVGDRVAINPGTVPTPCQYTREGLINHAEDMRFYGSAMRFPHVQGAFREQLVCEQSQLVKIPDHVTDEKAAFAEPLAVSLHAARQAGDLLNKRVLISGAGPIGNLVTLVAKLAGALEIVVTDIKDAPLATAQKMGATQTINVATDPQALADFQQGKGYFDIVFECSGSQAGITTALAVTRPKGTIVQVGLGNDPQVPLSQLVSRELTLKGTFRFIEEFKAAVATLARADVNIDPLLTAVMPFEKAVEAFELASDKENAMKVQLSFNR